MNELERLLRLLRSANANTYRIETRSGVKKASFEGETVDETLEAFEDVRLTDDTYDLHHVIKMVSGKDIIGVKGVAHLSMLDDGMSKNVEY